MESNTVEGAGGFTSSTGNSLSIYEDMKKIRVISKGERRFRVENPGISNISGGSLRGLTLGALKQSK
ncbi:hypothetical protein AV530_002611 [Patagioenas fasciata monilis]|uniref:Uncharacterized protein n=1 Tax=Patagioenas fasciata monilis TaxID=372326 RepID=A0A1V4K716_PATFA|nr:hypothetical protein AV530_002611 [Patagioenas fasciata monilis]